MSINSNNFDEFFGNSDKVDVKKIKYRRDRKKDNIDRMDMDMDMAERKINQEKKADFPEISDKPGAGLENNNTDKGQIKKKVLAMGRLAKLNPGEEYIGDQRESELKKIMKEKAEMEIVAPLQEPKLESSWWNERNNMQKEFINESRAQTREIADKIKQFQKGESADGWTEENEEKQLTSNESAERLIEEKRLQEIRERVDAPEEEDKMAQLWPEKEAEMQKKRIKEAQKKYPNYSGIVLEKYKDIDNKYSESADKEKKIVELEKALEAEGQVNKKMEQMNIDISKATEKLKLEGKDMTFWQKINKSPKAKAALACMLIGGGYTAGVVALGAGGVAAAPLYFAGKALLAKAGISVFAPYMGGLSTVTLSTAYGAAAGWLVEKIAQISNENDAKKAINEYVAKIEEITKSENSAANETKPVSAENKPEQQIINEPSPETNQIDIAEIIERLQMNDSTIISAFEKYPEFLDETIKAFESKTSIFAFTKEKRNINDTYKWLKNKQKELKEQEKNKLENPEIVAPKDDENKITKKAIEEMVNGIATNIREGNFDSETLYKSSIELYDWLDNKLKDDLGMQKILVSSIHKIDPVIQNKMVEAMHEYAKAGNISREEALNAISSLTMRHDLNEISGLSDEIKEWIKGVKEARGGEKEKNEFVSGIEIKGIDEVKKMTHREVSRDIARISETIVNMARGLNEKDFEILRETNEDYKKLYNYQQNILVEQWVKTKKETEEKEPAEQEKQIMKPSKEAMESQKIQAEIEKPIDFFGDLENNDVIDEVVTAKGSIYKYLEDGRTQRYKTAEKEGVEKKKEPQDAIVYIPDFDWVKKNASKENLEKIIGEYDNSFEYEQTLLHYVHDKGKAISISGMNGEALNTNSEIAAYKNQIYLNFGENGKTHFSIPVSRKPKVGFSTFDTRTYKKDGNVWTEKHIGNKVATIKLKQKELPIK